jgi:glycosyltransferase involved in cell wall biosynthesis
MIILFAGRLGGEKADALFVRESAASFAAAGIETIVIAPRRLRRGHYSSDVFRTVYLPTVDLFDIPILWSLANVCNLFFFSISTLVWLWLRGSRDDVILCNEPIPLWFASLRSSHTVYEVHIFPERNHRLYGRFFRRVQLFAPITDWTARQLGSVFGIASERIVVSRSGVNLNMFSSVSGLDARQQLGLEAGRSIVVYTGHLYDWKGVDTLAAAARSLPDVLFIYVGGTDGDVRRRREQWKEIQNIDVRGSVPHHEVGLWQSAADVLAIPNSASEPISVHYTSPMKLFEYMASKRPIVASDLPSIREVLSDDSAYLFTPDDPSALSAALRLALNDPNASLRAEAAFSKVQNFTWDVRSARILRHFGYTDATL